MYILNYMGNLFYNANKDSGALLERKRLRSDLGKALGTESIASSADSSLAKEADDVNYLDIISHYFAINISQSIC